MIRDRIAVLVRELRNRASDQATVQAVTLRQCADRLSQILDEEEGGWRLPPDAGICAYDLDECTITLALSNAAEVREAFRMLPDRHRMRVIPDSAIELAEPGHE